MKTANKGITLIFDLDETVINSSHRTPNNPDGTLNLQGYKMNHTPANVFMDTLLPLAATMKRAIASGYKVAVLTARDMAWFDRDFLKAHGINPKHIYSRDKCRSARHYSMSDGAYKVEWFNKMPPSLVAGQHVIMFDDSKPVKAAMRAIGVTCLCAHKVNARLYANARCK